MEIEDIQREKDADRNVGISLRTSEEKSNFMREKNISPTKLFNLALEEIMEANK